MKVIKLLILLFLIPFLTSSVFGASEVDYNEIQWGNQTINNIPITIADTSNPENTHNSGQVMISSATLVGFTSLGVIIGITFRGSNTQKLAQVVCIEIVVGLIIIQAVLHLFVIKDANAGVLDPVFYENVILASMWLIELIVTCFGVMLWLRASTGTKHNKTLTRTKSIISETTLQFSKSKTEDKY